MQLRYDIIKGETNMNLSTRRVETEPDTFVIGFSGEHPVDFPVSLRWQIPIAMTPPEQATPFGRSFEGGTQGWESGKLAIVENTTPQGHKIVAGDDLVLEGIVEHHKEGFDALQRAFWDAKAAEEAAEKAHGWDSTQVAEAKKAVAAAFQECQQYGTWENFNAANATQHNPTPEQLEEGVCNPQNHELIKQLITFDELPSRDQLVSRAKSVATALKGWKYAMIGGAPFFMAPLEAALNEAGITPIYAFTKRIVTEENGVKKSVFRHEGFIV